MKMMLLLYILVVFGPLLCEDNSIVGFRIHWRDSKNGNVFKARKNVFFFNQLLCEYSPADLHKDCCFLQIQYGKSFTFFIKQTQFQIFPCALDGSKPTQKDEKVQKSTKTCVVEITCKSARESCCCCFFLRAHVKSKLFLRRITKSYVCSQR